MGNIDLNYFCDVSSAISDYAQGYKATQGYTVGADEKHVVVALKSNSNGGFLEFSASGDFEKATLNKNLGHGNGCTYYNGYYYIVKGGGGIESPRILQLDKNFKLYRRYDCKRYDDQMGKEIKQNVSSITHLSNDYFILAKNDDAFICKRYSTGNSEIPGTFKVYSSFKMDDDGKIKNAFGDKFTYTPQSIFYSRSDYSLYRIVSYKDAKGVILRNTISKFSLSGEAPSYNSAKLEAIYKNTRDDGIKKFEIEAMSAYGDGTKYIAADILDEKNDECDAIFKIRLK